MWLTPLLQTLVVAAATVPAGGNPSAPATSAPAAAPVTAPAAPGTIYYTRQTLFAIPFHMDRPDRILREPVQVQLYVSGDRGASWQLYAKAEPNKQQFLFRAGVDGEFWFLLRTLDRSGQLHPDGQSAPGLKVIVDTTPPKLQLDTRRGPSGEVLVHWQLEELHPKPGSLTLQFRTAADAQWQVFAIDRPPPGGDRPTQTGEIPLYPPANVTKMELRATIMDMAGNTAISSAQVNLNAPPTVATPAPVIPATPNATLGLSGSAVAKAGSAWRAGEPDPPPTNWPAADVSPLRQLVGNGNEPQQTPATHPLRPADEPTRVALSDAGKTVSQDGSVAIQINPAGRSQFVAMSPATPNAAPAIITPAALPAGPRPRMVNSRVFELEYDIQSVGPSGIKQVELWCTRDAGRTWKRFAVEQGHRSPMVVTVNEEGTYGFCIVVQSRAGLSSPPPRSGDQPEISIGVDLTKPVVRITSAEHPSGDQSSNLLISWEASDNNLLAARPVTLSFSPTAGGPWTTIASGLEQSGHYSWAVGSSTPSLVYLRAEARDEAGNVGVYETPQPVALDRQAPTARIRDVHPVGQSGLQQPQQNLFR